jgi:hypothetical protein
MCNPRHEEHEYEGYTIKVIQDIDPQNPRKDFDNLGVMVCEHSCYDLGDGGMYLLRDAVRAHPLWHDCWEDDLEEDDNQWWLAKAERFGFIILPLYLYDHSGITMNTTGFSCPWDSGRVGVIFASPAKIRECHLLKPKQRISNKIKKLVIKVLKAEVEEYDQYLTGDVWGFIIEDSDGEEIQDGSCWGFFGQDYCLQDAKGVVDAEIERRKEQALLDAAKEQASQFVEAEDCYA